MNQHSPDHLTQVEHTVYREPLSPESLLDEIFEADENHTTDSQSSNTELHSKEPAGLPYTEATRIEQQSNQEDIESTVLSRNASIAFEGIPTVRGSDGRPHAFALVTGDPLNGRLTFNLRVTNRNDHFNLKDTQLLVRLTSKQSDGTWRQVNLENQSDNARFKRFPSAEVEDNSSNMVNINIVRSTLDRAYNSSSPLTRLEVEFHWRENFSRTDFYARTAITFHLVRPVELLLSRARLVGQVDTAANTTTNRPFHIPLWEKLFTQADREPYKVNVSVTTSVTRGSESSITLSSSTSETRGVSATASMQHGRSQSAEAGISFAKVVDLGLSSSSSFSFGLSATVERQVTRSIARSMAYSRSYTRGLSRTFAIENVVPPAPPGTRRALVTYPVFDKLEVDIVRFSGDRNGKGWATQRTTHSRVPMLRFSNWGIRHIDYTAQQRQATANRQITEDIITYPRFVEAGANRTLNASQVRFLILEGGGGKGLVYLGALKALESVRRGNGRPILASRNNRLVDIAGVAGSSAGAITALGLSMGMNTNELERISHPNFNFQKFFDKPSSPRKMPRVGSSCRNASTPGVLDEHIFNPVERAIASSLGQSVASRITTAVKGSLFRSATSGLRNNGSIPDKLLSPGLLFYIDNMISDNGIFSGCQARDFLNSMIINRGGSSNMTFSQHSRVFGTKLRVTGSNLETGRTDIFSSDHTPNMPVADAVRISMGLPVLFKPVRISSAQSRQIVNGARIRPTTDTAYQGLYVDGGLWNNLPMPIFADMESSNNPGSLGLALGQASLRRTPIRDTGEFLGALLGRFLGDDALANSDPAYRQQVITLDTGSIGTTDFAPAARVLARLQTRAEQQVRRYFA